MTRSKWRANIAARRPSREGKPLPERSEGERSQDAQLFREAVRGVRPLRQAPALPPPPKPRPVARFTRADRLAVLDESLTLTADDPDLEGGEVTSYARAGVRSSVLRKLRRGQYRTQAELDLHGLTARDAKAALREFLADALARGLSCVRIIHGKGLNSGPRGPVLRSTVSGFLQRSSKVLAFVSARSADGGTGAVYVLLSRV